MSENDNTPREWRFYVDDMLTFARKAQTYTEGLTQAEFIADERTFDATLRNLALIGEAAGRIPESVRAAHTDVPWRLIIATRHRLIHAYLGIDNDTVWSIIQDDLPDLLQALNAMQQSHS